MESLCEDILSKVKEQADRYQLPDKNGEQSRGCSWLMNVSYLKLEFPLKGGLT